LELVADEDAEARSKALEGVAAHLAAAGIVALRREAFDVRAAPDSEALARLDRGALSPLGVTSQGVHVNGRVQRPDGLHLWVGWRSKDKSVAPGKLDNLVAGGVPSGLSPMQTLLKEAAEEASMPPALAARARHVSRVSYRMGDRPGVRRDVLHCFDLDLPEDFTPAPADGEMERFELWPVGRVLEAVRDTPDVKFNVNLVLIDLFLREGLVDPRSEEGRRLRAGLDPGP
jgi:8-oxo-dGTP pyrophosphatase MutT (NUDIX family)